MVVVHGVGAQARGATISALIRAFGRVTTGGTGTEVGAQSEVLVQPADEQTDRIRVGAYYPHSSLDWRDETGSHSRAFYELYWADESRIGDSILNQMRSYWQLLVGLPRLGLYALDRPAGKPSRLMDHFARGCYVFAWVALIARFVVALIMTGLRLTGYASVADSFYPTLARCDAIRAGADILLVPTFFFWYMATCRCDRPVSRNILKTAWVALTVATMLTDLLTLGFRFGQYQLLQPILSRLTIGGNLSLPEPMHYRAGVYDPSSLYGLKTIRGPIWALGYALVLIWLLMAMPRFVADRLGGPRTRASVTPSPDDLKQKSNRAINRIFWIGFVVLLLEPVAYLVVYVVSGSGVPDSVVFLTYYTANSISEDQMIENDVFVVFDLVMRLTIGPFAFASIVLLTWPAARMALLPGLELALDVLNYLRPRRLIDSWLVSRFLLGGRRSSAGTGSSTTYCGRGHALVVLAGQRHGSPVTVVAHSLGSIIALSALENWSIADLKVDLLTMGSPLMVLAERLPAEFGAARADAGHRALPAVGRWRNYYFEHDSIGRRLEPGIAAPPTVFEPDHSLGDGTHTEYFVDQRFARVLLG